MGMKFHTDGNPGSVRGKQNGPRETSEMLRSETTDRGFCQVRLFNYETMGTFDAIGTFDEVRIPISSQRSLCQKSNLFPLMLLFGKVKFVVLTFEYKFFDVRIKPLRSKEGSGDRWGVKGYDTRPPPPTPQKNININSTNNKSCNPSLKILSNRYPLEIPRGSNNFLKNVLQKCHVFLKILKGQGTLLKFIKNSRIDHKIIF